MTATGNKTACLMKKILILALGMVFALFACNKENSTVIDEPVGDGAIEMTFTGSLEQLPETKTYLEWDGGIPGYKVGWWAGNEIRVFDGTATARKFTASTKGESSDFTGSAAAAATYYALYPYQADAECTAGGVFTAELPATQPLVAGELADNLNLTVAMTTGTSFAFKNVGTILAFRLTNVITNCSYVTIEGNNSETLAGTLTIDYNGGDPSVTSVASPSTVVTLTNSNPTLDSGTYFCVVNPVNITGGFTITFYDGSDNEITHVSSTKPVNMTRGKLLNLGTLPLKPTINGTALTYDSVNKRYYGDFTFDGSAISMSGIDIAHAVNPDFFSYSAGVLTFLRSTSITWTVEYFTDYNFIWVSNTMLGFPDVLYVVGNGKSACPTYEHATGEPGVMWNLSAPYFCVAPLIETTAEAHTLQVTMSVSTGNSWGDVRVYFGKGGGNWATLSSSATVISGDNASSFEIADDGGGTMTLHSKAGFNKDGYYRMVLTYDRTENIITGIALTKLD